MTIILFLIDTSASMRQRVNSRNGRIPLIDLTKTAVEAFINARSYKSDSNGDRYMLLTFEDFPNNIKAGWKENLTTFMNELKNLQCDSRTVMGGALRQAFDLLNLNRMQYGIDTYGQGRSPFYSESALIILITDGGLYCTNTSVSEELHIPLLTQVPGSELTKEPFRWDQRIYALVLRIPGVISSNSDVEYVRRDHSHIDAMCEVTGGRSYCITTPQMLFQCIESLVQKVQEGVVIRFEMLQSLSDKFRENETTSKPYHSVRNIIYVPRSSVKKHSRYWPIPESYWPDITLSTLPPRNAQPKVVYRCINSEAIFHKNIPFDKYRLEPSLLTQSILGRRDENICWQVYVLNSGKHHDSCHPFGYLKVNSRMNSVYLIVLPYNFPVLIPLIDELIKELNLKPTHDWLKKFHGYLSTVPMYYHNLLKNVLSNIGVHSVILQTMFPKFIISQLSYNLQTYLRNLRNRAKLEHEILCDHIFGRGTKKMFSDVRVIPVNHFCKTKQSFVTHPCMTKNLYPIKEYPSQLIQIKNKNSSICDMKNPFTINRSDLLANITNMRLNFFKTPSQIITTNMDKKHSLPVTEMGNYMDNIIRNLPQTLRELQPSQHRSVRNLFGNPFKSNHSAFMVDEADGHDENSIQPNDGIKHSDTVKSLRKRRQGPLPKNYSMENLKAAIEEQQQNTAGYSKRCRRY